MKNVLLDSLNTTVSISPYRKPFNRTPIELGHRKPTHRLTTCPSATFDIKGSTFIRTSQKETLQSQIQQLRKQNQVLKSQLKNLSSDNQNGKWQYQAKTQRRSQEIDKKIEGLPMSIEIFWQQIKQLISSMVNVFKLETTVETTRRMGLCKQKYFQQEIFEEGSILNKEYLQKCIESIMVKKEEERFQNFIDLFGSYYKAKQERDKRLIEQVDVLTAKVSQLMRTLNPKNQQKHLKEEQKFEYYSPKVISGLFHLKEVGRTQPFTRKHGRNKSNLVSTDQSTTSSIKFIRTGNQTSNNI